jgi:hypothetical protein
MVEIETFWQSMGCPGGDGTILCQPTWHGEPNVSVTGLAASIVLAKVIETL